MKAREEPLPVLFTSALIAALTVELRFGRSGVLALSFEPDEKGLLICEPAFSLDNLAFDMSKLVRECVSVHDLRRLLRSIQQANDAVRSSAQTSACRDGHSAGRARGWEAALREPTEMHCNAPMR
ncbi:hypothetical protein JQ543_15370 [Bradyrhizobium diazoefficiens]|nr:hypothetical protein [Bradyrhizobium diazoefficiens]MBR0849130.1 hypothetical protein [Bradyrhizobium diazoefficiens]